MVENSLRKAQDVLRSMGPAPSGAAAHVLVVAADTVVVHDGAVLEKPSVWTSLPFGRLMQKPKTLTTSKTPCPLPLLLLRY